MENEDSKFINPEEKIVAPQEAPDFFAIASEINNSGVDISTSLAQASKRVRDSLLNNI